MNEDRLFQIRKGILHGLGNSSIRYIGPLVEELIGTILNQQNKIRGLEHNCNQLIREKFPATKEYQNLCWFETKDGLTGMKDLAINKRLKFGDIIHLPIIDKSAVKFYSNTDKLEFPEILTRTYEIKFNDGDGRPFLVEI